MRQAASSVRVTVEAVVTAKNQFLALAAGATVSRTSRNSPVRLTGACGPGCISGWLSDFGREWVVAPHKRVWFTLEGDAEGQARVSASLCVSVTLGVVAVDWGLGGGPPAGVTVHGTIGRGRFLADRLVEASLELFVVDRESCGGAASADTSASLFCVRFGGIYHDPLCNSSWILLSGLASLEIWKVIGGVPQAGRSLPPIEPARELVSLRGDTAVLFQKTADGSTLQRVDVPRTYKENALVLCGKPVSVPTKFRPDCAFIVGNTVYSLTCDSSWIFSLFNSETGNMHTFDSSFSAFEIDNEHLFVCRLDNSEQLAYHVTDLESPVHSVKSLPMEGQPSLLAAGLTAKRNVTFSPHQSLYSIMDALSGVTFLSVLIDTASASLKLNYLGTTRIP
ncbi:hypothetical protein Pelo_10121 [Pelomyxa schiedti]|nr:hypothetical protein Pelo_10121 [Pelomyxa schiedti]